MSPLDFWNPLVIVIDVNHYFSERLATICGARCRVYIYQIECFTRGKLHNFHFLDVILVSLANFRSMYFPIAPENRETEVFYFRGYRKETSQLTFTCRKSIIEILEEGVKHVQS